MWPVSWTADQQAPKSAPGLALSELQRNLSGFSGFSRPQSVDDCMAGMAGMAGVAVNSWIE